MLLLAGMLAFFSCSTEKVEDPVYTEAVDIFTKAYVEGRINNLIEDDKLYYAELAQKGKISMDSMLSYAKIFSSIVKEGFHLDGKDSLIVIFREKERFDEFNKNFIEKGFSGLCDALGQYNELGGKPESDYSDWLKKYDLKKEDFESEIITASIDFGRVCRTKYYIEFEKNKPVDGYSNPNQKYSSNALSLSESRVTRWISNGDLKINLDLDEVHISPNLWNALDVDGKKEVVSSILVYIEGVEGHDFSYLDFKDKNTDKEIASWSSVYGIKFKN